MTCTLTGGRKYCICRNLNGNSSSLTAPVSFSGMWHCSGENGNSSCHSWDLWSGYVGLTSLWSGRKYEQEWAMRDTRTARWGIDNMTRGSYWLPCLSPMATRCNQAQCCEYTSSRLFAALMDSSCTWHAMQSYSIFCYCSRSGRPHTLYLKHGNISIHEKVAPDWNDIVRTSEHLADLSGTPRLAE